MEWRSNKELVKAYDEAYKEAWDNSVNDYFNHDLFDDKIIEALERLSLPKDVDDDYFIKIKKYSLDQIYRNCIFYIA